MAMKFHKSVETDIDMTNMKGPLGHALILSVEVTKDDEMAVTCLHELKDNHALLMDVMDVLQDYLNKLHDDLHAAQPDLPKNGEKIH